MLNAVSQHHHRRIPLVGLNAGTLGYLHNDGSITELEERLERGLYRLYRQPLLHVEFTTQDGLTRNAHTFNEAFLRAVGDQAAWMRVVIDGVEQFGRLVGDGLMVSTPAGSTGWAYALGATSVMIGTSQVILTADAATHNDRRWVSAPLPMHATRRGRGAGRREAPHAPGLERP